MHNFFWNFMGNIFFPGDYIKVTQITVRLIIQYVLFIGLL